MSLLELKKMSLLDIKVKNELGIHYFSFQINLNGIKIVFDTLGDSLEIPDFLEGKKSLEYDDGTFNGIYCLLKLTRDHLNFTVNEKSGGRPRVDISIPRDSNEVQDFLNKLSS
jgi:hypothetical protein